MRSPSLLVPDGPTVGVDVEARRTLKYVAPEEVGLEQAYYEVTRGREPMASGGVARLPAVVARVYSGGRSRTRQTGAVVLSRCLRDPTGENRWVLTS